MPALWMQMRVQVQVGMGPMQDVGFAVRPLPRRHYDVQLACVLVEAPHAGHHEVGFRVGQLPPSLGIGGIGQSPIA